MKAFFVSSTAAAIQFGDFLRQRVVLMLAM